VARRLAPRIGPWNAGLAGGVAFLAVIGVAMAMLPWIDEVPAAFPASLLWRFRLAALGMQLGLWATIGLVFGLLVERRSDIAPVRRLPAAG
jgi:predicted cobalt transporter CbtA